MERITALINREHADAVALQEVERGSRRLGHQDLVAELARLTQMNYAFGKNFETNHAEYGNALLTRFPIVQQDNLLYRMLRPRKQRGLMEVVLSVEGRELLLLNTHLDYLHDDEQKVLNLEEIKQARQRHANLPVILCGDFNSTPDSSTHQCLGHDFFDVWERVGQGKGYTSHRLRVPRRIDYIFVDKTSALLPLNAKVPGCIASDHLPVEASFTFADTPNDLRVPD